MTTPLLSQSVTSPIAPERSVSPPLKLASLEDEDADDWRVEVEPYVSPNIGAPSFIRLFIIRRILSLQLKNDDTGDAAIETLVSVLINSYDRSKATTIISKLMKYGIKDYMHEHYDENDQTSTIELIFHQIILNQFEKEYEDITTYKYTSKRKKSKSITKRSKHKNNKRYFRSLVFNTNSVMCLVFTFLEYGMKFDKDLFNCSLVCSQWLYYVYNPNSIYHINLNKLIEEILEWEYNEYDDNNVTRMWQRLMKAKSLHLETTSHTPEISEFILNKLNMLDSIKSINCCIYNDKGGIDILKVLMQKCKQNIGFYNVQTRPNSKNKQNTLSPLSLIKAKEIFIYSSYYYVVWTNMCKVLRLIQVEIDAEWCNKVIKYCDCTGIENMILDDTLFVLGDELLIKKFSQKFQNLKNLTVIQRYNEPNIHLWQFLNDLDLINKININLVLPIECTTTLKQWNGKEFAKMVNNYNKKDIKKDKLTLKELVFPFKSLDDDGMKMLKRVLLNMRTEIVSFEINNEFYNRPVLTSIIKILKQSNKCVLSQSLKVLKYIVKDNMYSVECVDDGLSMIYNFLNLDLIIECKLFVMADFTVDIDVSDSKYNPKGNLNLNSLQSYQKFERLCGRIFLFLTTMKIAICINIRLRNINESDINSRFYQRYKATFDDKKIENKYNKPICNQYCQPLDKPLISFKYTSMGRATFHVSNATLIQAN